MGDGRSWPGKFGQLRYFFRLRELSDEERAILSKGNRPLMQVASMTIRKLTIADAVFERSPGQDGEVFTGNIIDERHGGPITIGYGRYGPDQTLKETMVVDDVMIVLEGRLTVSAGTTTVTAGPGEMVYMPKGEAVTIRSHEGGAVTAYVTYPHWKQVHT